MRILLLIFLILGHHGKVQAAQEFSVTGAKAAQLIDIFELMGAELIEANRNQVFVEVLNTTCEYRLDIAQARYLTCSIHFRHSDGETSQLRPRSRDIIHGFWLVAKELNFQIRGENEPLERPVISLKNIYCERHGRRTRCEGVDNLR